jgi:hypothetical protein
MRYNSVSNPNPLTNPKSTGIHLLQPDAGFSDARSASPLLDLLMITSRRGSAFFAEAAVLVLVFGILDLCLLKGHIELHWIIAALAISVGLLTASIAMDFAAHRWVKAHP